MASKRKKTMVVCKRRTAREEALLRAVRAVIARELRYTVRVLDTFTDDHILGCVVSISGHGLKTATLALPWCGWEGVAAAKYANDSDAAYDLFVEMLAEADKDDEGMLDTFDPRPWAAIAREQS